MRIAAVVLLIALLQLCACTSVGTKEIADPSQVSKIEVGKSSKAEVRAILGEPTKVNFADSGEETWEYVHVRVATRAATFIPIVGLFAGGADVKSHSFTVRFDSAGIVKRCAGGKMEGGGGGLID